MGDRIDLCPTEAATGELYDWYDEDPWQDVLAPHSAEEPSGKERGHPAAKESVRDIVSASNLHRMAD